MNLCNKIVFCCLSLAGTKLAASTPSSWTPLMTAAAQGDAAKVQQLIKDGADVSGNSSGFNALMAATGAAIQDTDDLTNIVKALLDAHIDVNAIDNLHSSALMRAARGGELTIVKLLTQHGAKTNIQDHEGKSPLLYALEGASYNSVTKPDTYLAIVDELIKNKADVKIKDNTGGTPLIYAVAMGLPAAFVRKLLQAGARVNDKDSRGRGVMYFADAELSGESGASEEVRRLLKKAGAR